MKLIEYKTSIDEAFRQGKNKGDDTNTLCFIDIAHSLSILAEESVKDKRRKAKKARADYQSRYYKGRRKEA